MKYMRRTGLLLLLACSVVSSMFANPFCAEIHVQDAYYGNPSGYETIEAVQGDWDYDAFVSSSCDSGRKYKIACSVMKLLASGERFAVLAETTKYDEELDIYTSGLITVLFQERPKLRDADNVIIYCRFVQLSQYRDRMIPFFAGDGWQFLPDESLND